MGAIFRLHITLLIIYCTFFCCNVFAAEQHQTSYISDSIRAKVDKLVEDEMKAKGLQGYALAIIKNGKSIIKKGYGLANVEKALPVTAKTVFGLASLTKTFTAICILSLVDQRKVALGDTIDQYLTNLPKHYQKLTVRQLATMTAGVPSFVAPEVEWDNQLSILTAQPLESKPGSSYSYSNFSYRLLGSVIEKVTGKPFMGVVDEIILKPNGMTDTGTVVSPNTAGLVAQGYDAKGKVTYRKPEVSFSSGMLASNLEDMTKYVQALLARKMLSQRSYEIMWYERLTLADGRKPWSFGWTSKTARFYGKTHVVEWMGSNVGVASTLMILPEKDGAVISLCSSQNPSAHQLSQKIADIIFGSRQ
jgi:CubicO group peptidase (beta-lactamase class C family)